jgi:adenine-specific DNA-methyltransferase
MNLKQMILDCLEASQLRELCADLEINADRRSVHTMRDAIARAKRAKPERLIMKLSEPQLRTMLLENGLPADGASEVLMARLLKAGGRLVIPSVPVATEVAEAPAGYRDRTESPARRRSSEAAHVAESYLHLDEVVQRPAAGVQDQFLARKPPRTYRYDSSLDPALSWDEQPQRDLGEWLLGLVVKAANEGEQTVFAEPQVWAGGGVRVSSLADAAQMLQQISKPFLNWAGKAERHEIRVPTAPLFVHERHSTKAILDGIRHRKARGQTLDLFGDAGMDIRENLEAYEHKGPWQNRMILGDSLSAMNSLLEFEGLGGQVQMIYIDPPYGVKFGSNFQPFVRKRDVKHGGDEDMTREPEMVKAYRDTWELGLHSYLTYLRDRMTVARELLHPSGSVFVQISDENVHYVRNVLDEVFGSGNFCRVISIAKTSGLGATLLPVTKDFILWYARDVSRLKYRQLFVAKLGQDDDQSQFKLQDEDGRPFRHSDLTGQNNNVASCIFEYQHGGKTYRLPKTRQ